MAIARKFLDWNQLALPAVADYLAQRFRRDTTLDLDNVILVLPGGRAGRSLTELLVERCQQQSLVLFPPEHCTVGTLPEYLYESKRPFATDLVQQLAWVQALKTTDRERCQLFAARLPRDDDYANWMELGALLQRQHRELAADALDFAQVARRGADVTGFQEQPRWQLLSEVQQRYLEILDALQLWDLQTARLFAIQHRLCQTNKQIVLVGTTDMNAAMRQMLDLVADQVTALIHAPETLADRFDKHGCLNPDAWQNVQIPVATQQIHVVEGPANQASEVIHCIAALDGRYRADQIVVGVLDEMLVPQLLRRLQESHVSARWVVGKVVRETAPFRLLDALASYMERGRYIDLAALARHPDLTQWLAGQGIESDWLTDLDRYYNQHLPPHLERWLGDDDDTMTLRQVVTLLHKAIKPLQDSARPLTQWAPAIAQLLMTFYGRRIFQIDQQHEFYSLQALEQLRNGLCAQQQIPPEIAPHLTAAEAIRQLLSQVEGVQIPSPHGECQIELLGWLELPLDSAPALVITGFNEGNVPTSVNSDLFLPNSLRQQLDLVDNRRRYARDAYALSVLQASRRADADRRPVHRRSRPTRTQPTGVCHGRGNDGPAHHAILPAQESEAVAHPLITTGDNSEEASGIVVPKPASLDEPITAISVTSFRTYIDCPYRFYLSHVLRLQAVDDMAEELDGASFGTLIHDVLKRFGRDPVRKSTDPAKIGRFLDEVLHELVSAQFGKDHLPAVNVQIVQARQRLEAFAHWQAQRAADGWEIVHTESSGGKDATRLPLGNGTSVILRGRIDRIDHKEGTWAILDYKTGDQAKSPQETHLKAGKWIDLQLPLYVPLRTRWASKARCSWVIFCCLKRSTKWGTTWPHGTRRCWSKRTKRQGKSPPIL